MKRIEHSLSEFAVPHSEDAECMLLNDCIINSSLIADVREIVKPEMFFIEPARNLWAVLLRMSDDREYIDISTVYPKADAEFLRTKVICRTDAGGSLSAIEHAAIIKSAYVKRQAYFTALDLMMKSTNPSVDEEEILGVSAQFYENMTREMYRRETKSIVDVINSLATDLKEGSDVKVTSSFHNLDYITYGGFSGGELIIMAARPSVGKTAVMLQMAREASRTTPVLCMSLEMTDNQIAKRLLIGTHYIEPGEMIKGEVDWQKFEWAAAEYNNKSLYIDDKVSTIDEVCSTIVLNHQKGRCGIAFVDYLGLMEDEGDNSDKVAIAIAKKTRRLKRLAIQLNIPIVILCQLNRNSVRDKRAPELHDLRDSGAIEQDADIVLMLEKNESLEEDNNHLVLWVRKNRSGRAGQMRIDLDVDSTYTNFTETR